MKKQYNHPELQVTELAPLPLMQAASPVGDTMGLHDIEGEQW